MGSKTREKGLVAEMQPIIGPDGERAAARAPLHCLESANQLHEFFNLLIRKS